MTPRERAVNLVAAACLLGYGPKIVEFLAGFVSGEMGIHPTDIEAMRAIEREARTFLTLIIDGPTFPDMSGEPIAVTSRPQAT